MEISLRSFSFAYTVGLHGQFERVFVCSAVSAYESSVQITYKNGFRTYAGWKIATRRIP